MTIYRYRGRTLAGEEVRGELEADSEGALLQALAAQNIAPIEYAEGRVSRWPLSWKRKPDISIEDKVMFCRQLHSLLKAGVPTVQAINGLRRSTENESLAEVLHQVEQSLEAGLPLAASLQAQGDTFEDLFVAMVHVGENTGRLDEAFARLASYLEMERVTRQRVKQALRYPTFVVVAITIALFIINLLVIPQFAQLFAKFQTELPLPTRFLMAMSNVFVHYWWAMLMLGGGMFAAFRHYIRTPTGMLWWHEQLLRLPIFGKLMRHVVLGRFARTFAMTYSAGLPILQSLVVVSRAVANRFVEQRVLSMRAGIERGESFTRTAHASRLFTPLVLQMISVGETTGALDSLLNEVGAFYEQEVEYGVKRLGDAIEPILLVFIGIMVLVLALGVFLPMWDMYSLFTHRS